ncbi:hypothetical protein AMELA_G00245700 [Ameiurus melas]|uniref:Uncharacterized protein n=1 Tax=Ameiurus melas TaxID=219545 RepID=A0A7J5ZVF9_AMEME|nr:hypothetical protein AMELA_G00245700 [Ameiurus melas]
MEEAMFVKATSASSFYLRFTTASFYSVEMKVRNRKLCPTGREKNNNPKTKQDKHLKAVSSLALVHMTLPRNTQTQTLRKMEDNKQIPGMMEPRWSFFLGPQPRPG